MEVSFESRLCVPLCLQLVCGVESVGYLGPWSFSQRVVGSPVW